MKKIISFTIAMITFILTLATPAYATSFEDDFEKAKETIATATNSKKENVLLFEDGADSSLWENILSDNEQYSPDKIYYYSVNKENIVIAFDVTLISDTTGEHNISGLKGFYVDEKTIRFYPLNSLTIAEIDNVVNILNQKVKVDEMDKAICQYDPPTRPFYGSIDARPSKNQSEDFKRAKELVANAFNINAENFSLLEKNNEYFVLPHGSKKLYMIFNVKPISNEAIRNNSGNMLITDEFIIYFETSNMPLNNSALEIVSAIDNEANQTLSVEQIAFWIILLGYAIIVGVFFGGFFLVKKIMTKKR